MPRAEAEELRDLYRSQIRAGTFNAVGSPAVSPASPSTALTLGDVLDVYLTDHVRKPTRRPQGRRTMEYRLGVARAMEVTISGRQKARLDQLPFAEVRQPHIEELEREWLKRAKSRTGEHQGRVGANRGLAVLRAFFKWSIRKGYRDDSPFMRHGVVVIAPDMRSETARVRRLLPGEEDRLLAHARPRTYALIATALDTGCRAGELLSLQWHQVQFAQGSIVLPAPKTKTNSTRAVPMTARVRGLLEMRQLDPAGEKMPPTAYVFGNAVGERIASFRKGWLKATRGAKVEGLHFHDLRREFGSRMLEAGVPLHVVSRLLGHTNIATTSRYLAATVVHEHDAIRKLEEHLNRTPPPKPEPDAPDATTTH
jgi:integrase